MRARSSLPNEPVNFRASKRKMRFACDVRFCHRIARSCLFASHPLLDAGDALTEPAASLIGHSSSNLLFRCVSSWAGHAFFVVGIAARPELPQALVGSGRGALLSDALGCAAASCGFAPAPSSAPDELQRRAGFPPRRSHRQTSTSFSTLQQGVPPVHMARSTTASLRATATSTRLRPFLRASRARKLRRDERWPRPFMIVLA